MLLGYVVDGLVDQVWYLVVWYYNWMVMVMKVTPQPVQFKQIFAA